MPGIAPARRLAVIDLGSNTARVLVCDVTAAGLISVVDEQSVTLELGRRLADGRLDQHALVEVMEVLEDFVLIARGAGAESISAVGTAALRSASNAGALLRVAKRRLGLSIEIVDGDEEGRLAFHGAVASLPVNDGLLIDLGGGSLELVEFRERRLLRTWSLPLGALRVADQFFATDPPTAVEVRAARRHIRRALGAASLPLLPPGATLVGTGGNVRTLARVDRRRQRYPVLPLQGYPLPVARLRRVVTRLLALPSGPRGAVPGLNPERAYSILGGGLVIEAVAGQVGATEILTAGEGLREGRARDIDGADLPSIVQVRGAALAHLRDRLPAVERERVRCLAALAVALHHAFGAESDTLEVLTDAAVLLALGGSLDFYSRGARASDVVLASGIPGYSHRDVARVASVLRLVEREDAPLASLKPLIGPDEHEALRRCAALLGLADAILRRTPPDRARAIEVARAGDEVTVHVPVWPSRTTGDVTARVSGLFGARVTVSTRPPS